jgi:glycosyltransferase involved in cell wall biosynthesis
MNSVSLIIPCHNHADTLASAVASALAQSALTEVIIVDDDSTYNSLAIANDLVKKDDKIRVVQTDINIGPGGARNTGAKIATATHLSFLDADDELLGDFFSEALSILDNQKEMRVVKGEMEFYDPCKGYILPIFDPRHSAAVLSSSCGMVMDRQAFINIGGFPRSPTFRGPFGGEDVAFMRAVMEHFQPVGRIEYPCYRVWSQSNSHVDQFLRNTRLKDKTFEFVNLHPDQKEDSALSKAIVDYLNHVTLRINQKK